MNYIRASLGTITIFAINYYGLYLYLSGHIIFGYINSTISMLCVYFVTLHYMESDFFKSLGKSPSNSGGKE